MNTKIVKRILQIERQQHKIMKQTKKECGPRASIDIYKEPYQMKSVSSSNTSGQPLYIGE